jgi:hypothetical protein
MLPSLKTALDALYAYVQSHDLEHNVEVDMRADGRVVVSLTRCSDGVSEVRHDCERHGDGWVLWRTRVYGPNGVRVERREE